MIERARSVYFIGDSNTIAYRYIAVRAPDGTMVVTCAGRLLMRTCSSLLSDEALAEPLESFLRGRLFDAAAPPPVVVLMVGTMDLAYVLDAIGPRTDVHASEGGYLEGPFAGPRFPLLPSALLDRTIARTFEPLRRAIDLLKSAGARRLVLHSLHPPTLDDVRYFAVRRIACSARARYGTVLAINRYLERIARESEIAFLDMWDATTEGGVLDERLSFDGDHLNHEGALLTVDALIRAGLY